jgi:hypothetical protein
MTEISENSPRVAEHRSSPFAMLGWLALLIVIALWGFKEFSDALAAVFLIPIEEQGSLYRDEAEEICWTSHRKPGMMGRAVYQVWTKPVDSNQWTTILTLEPAQDVPIGQPIAKQTSNSIVLTDEAGSFEFDLQRKVFIMNEYPESVYSGPFRCCEPPH